MKIVRNQPDILILQSAPWVLGGVLVAVIILLTGLGLHLMAGGNTGAAILCFAFGPGFTGLFFIMFVRRDDLVLDRQRNLVELYHANVLGHQTTQHSLHHLRRAIVQSRRTRHGDPAYRAVLELDNGVHRDTAPVTEIFVDGPDAERDVAAINRWLGVSDLKVAG